MKFIESIEACALRIPFRCAFSHASASRKATETLWVVARACDGSVGHGEGCPRAYVTGETLGSARAFVAARANEWRSSIRDLESLSDWADAHRADIDRHPSAWAAVELALLDLIGKREGCTLESLLGLPDLAGSFRYSAVLGDSASGEFGAQLAAYRQAGFEDFKIKLIGDRTRDRAKVHAIRGAGLEEARVRADANNLWPDATRAAAYLSTLGFGFWAIEEPLRAGDYAGMRRLSNATGAKIVLDESICRVDQLGEIEADAATWIVNLRLSKMGGVLRSLAFACAARNRGLKLVIGAHVGETSVLTRAAIAVAQAVGDCVVAREGAFGTHLLQCDVVERPIMFGRGGLLDVAPLAAASAPGLGLPVTIGNCDCGPISP